MSASQTARNVAVTLAILGSLYVLWLIRDVVLILLLAVFVAVALSAPVAFVQRRLRLPRAAAILIVYLLIAGFMALIGFIVIPPLVREIEEFIHEVPRYVRELEDSATLRKWDEEYGLFSKLQEQAGKLPSILSKGASELESITIGAIERAVKLIAVLAIAFLLLLDSPRLSALLYARVGAEREARARRLTSQAASAITGYVAGAFAVALLAGFVSFIAMTILGIPFAIPLAVQMAFFALIPLVGSTIGAIVITLVGLFEGLGTALAFVAFFVVYQQLETHVLGPFVYRRTVAMRPVLVIVSVLVGASLLGILGAILAIPAAATIQIVLQEWWRARHPEQPDPLGPDRLDAEPPADGAPEPGRT